MPDVLCYRNGYTTLYEIKISASDFKKDFTKPCRIKYKLQYKPGYKIIKGKKKPVWLDYYCEKKVNEIGHLGLKRYYISPPGIIKKEEILNGWGLYYIKKNRFYLQKESDTFRRNIYLEMTLLVNAIRRVASGFKENIITKAYVK
jgi:hypothetical protein